MTSLTTHLENYLNVRRNLGYDLSTAERVLRRFTCFVDDQGADHITVDMFLRWKEQFGSANNNTWSRRLGMVRLFAAWLQGIDPRNEVPPVGLISGKNHRPRPYIYTPEQIANIVSAAAKLPSPYGLRGKTCSTMFGLIAVTGLRVSEAIGLDEKDVDLDNAVLTVRCGKNGKFRFVPISSCAVDRLGVYRAERNRLLGTGRSPFFLHESGQRPGDCSVRYNFARISQFIGLRDRQVFHKHGRGPRIHDLRHTFAARTIIDWYKKGLDPDREMIKLSTYLGHSKPEYTYWYIEAVPELLRLASMRAERSITAGGEA
ncbi:MAG: tyrosine-type recombinase/integrase [Desulfobulbaceae bacterium]|nr:tyrosine-type recombinase/integrase [Desulfobulbaceae bacterium]